MWITAWLCCTFQQAQVHHWSYLCNVCKRLLVDNCTILLLQLKLQAKLDSLEKLDTIPHHVEVLEKVLLDSAMEAFTSELHVSFS